MKKAQSALSGAVLVATTEGCISTTPFKLCSASGMGPE